MLSIEHVFLSLVANVLILMCIHFFKFAPPRLVVYFSLAGMMSIFIPWRTLGESISVSTTVYPAILTTASTLIEPVSSTLSRTELASTPYSEWGMTLWLLISMLLITRTLWNDRRTRKTLLQTATQADHLGTHVHESLLPLLDRVRLYGVPNRTLIATSGIWTSDIWIGENVTDRIQLRTAVNHELCHIVTHDQFILLTTVLMERFLWWNPAIWLLGRQVRRHMEYSCDERCKALLGEREYQHSLAALFLNQQPGTMTLGLPLGDKSDLVHRIERIKMTSKLTVTHLLLITITAALAMSVAAATGSKTLAETSTLLGCFELIPEGVQYEFRVSSDIDTRKGREGEMSVSLVEPGTEPSETKLPPAGSERFLECVGAVVGIEQGDGWPGREN